jgi:aspartate/methionine/tyrosine aminotransferase
MLQLVPNLQRLGTETAFEVLARAAELERKGKSIINLGIGQPDFKTPQHIVEAAIRALRDGHHGYTPAQGILPLREAVAKDLKRRHDVEVSPDDIVIMPGGKPTMFFSILMFGQHGAEILYPDPGFPIYRSMIQYTGAKPVPIALLEENEFAFTADQVLSQITPKTSLIILNSPNNPCGGAVPAEEVKRLAAGLERHPHVAVMSDEIYGQMLYGNRKHESFLRYPEIRDRLIILDGWSKTYAMTGWRLGFSVWPRSLVDHVVRLAVNCHSCVNAPTQYAGIAALEGPQDEARKMVAAFDERRRVIVPLLNQLPGFRCLDPGGAFYVFPNITGTGMDARELQNKMLETAGVATVAGTSFGIHGEGYIRFSYANSVDNIREAIKRLAALLRD